MLICWGRLCHSGLALFSTSYVWLCESAAQVSTSIYIFFSHGFDFDILTRSWLQKPIRYHEQACLFHVVPSYITMHVIVYLDRIPVCMLLILVLTGWISRCIRVELLVSFIALLRSAELGCDHDVCFACNDPNHNRVTNLTYADVHTGY